MTTTGTSLTLTDLDPDSVYNLTLNAATEAGYGRGTLRQAVTGEMLDFFISKMINFICNKKY